MRATDNIPIRILSRLFIADFEAGRLLHRGRPGTSKTNRMFNSKYAGKAVGSLTGDYLRTQIFNPVTRKHKHYLVHRILFAMFHGYYPEIVDHIDKDTVNNRIDNLRDATRAENKQNSLGYKNNVMGLKGVRQIASGKYMARITVPSPSGGKGRLLYLGLHDTPQEARDAYAEAAEEHHGEYAKY